MYNKKKISFYYFPGRGVCNIKTFHDNINKQTHEHVKHTIAHPHNITILQYHKKTANTPNNTMQ